MSKKLLKFYLLIFTVSLCAFSNVSASAKDEWFQVKSKNFTMIGNAGEKEIRRVATKLEQFREVFRQLLPQMQSASPVPTSVIVFKDDKSFAPFKPVNASGQPSDWVTGFFLKGEDVNYITLSTEGKDEQVYTTIFHEYTHFLVDNAIGRSKIPPWLNEGFAEYYERFKIEDDQKVTLGAVNNNHLVLLAQRSFIPFNTFFTTDYYTLNRQGKDRVGVFYAQAWALMHYLLHSDDGTRKKQLDEFIDLLAQGKTPREAFPQAFQTNFVAMQLELRNYVGQKKFNSFTTNLKEKLVFDAQMQTSRISESDSKAILGDLLLHASRFGEATAYLQQALQLNPNSGQANMSLGLVRLKLNDFAGAKIYLKKAVEADDKNYLAHYQYAYVLSREALTETGFATRYDKALADEIKEEVKKSIALNPNYAESYSLYAFVSAVRNEDVDESLEFIKKALAISPGNQKYLIREAELLLRKEDFSAARAIAQKIYETASDSQLRLYAQNTINLINSTEAQLEAIKDLKNQARSEIISDEPVSEAELAKRNALAINQSLNQSLRRPAADEKRILAFLTKVECSGKTVEFSARRENQILKFQAANFDSLFLMSYNAETSEAQIGCDTITKEIFTVITYKPSDDAKSKFAGEIVAIEFIPETFKLLE
jgi:thioredoxin-like negative regulator of GroEL